MKTRSKIDFKNVFIRILEDDPGKTVTASDIIKNSDYSRSTFYRNYYDYDDFLKQILQEEATWLAKGLFQLMEEYSMNSSLKRAVLENILSGIYSRKSLYHFIFTAKDPGLRNTGSGFSFLVMEEFKNLGSFVFNDAGTTVDEEFFRFSETIRFLRYIFYWDMKNYEFSIEYMVHQIQSMNDLNYDKGNLSSFFVLGN